MMVLLGVFVFGFFTGYFVFAAVIASKFRRTVGQPEYAFGNYLIKVRRSA